MTLLQKIKLLFQIKQPVENLVGEVKQIKVGYKTAGFWVAVLGTLITIATTLGGYIPASIGLIVTTLLTLGYNVIRAFQNADVSGIQPLMLSTRFWVGILGIVSTALVSLKSNGIDPKWVESALGLIAAVMAGAQSVGSVQPSKPA